MTRNFTDLIERRRIKKCLKLIKQWWLHHPLHATLKSLPHANFHIRLLQWTKSNVCLNQRSSHRFYYLFWMWVGSGVFLNTPSCGFNIYIELNTLFTITGNGQKRVIVLVGCMMDIRYSTDMVWVSDTGTYPNIQYDNLKNLGY